MTNDQPLRQFLDELASPAPTPGGGGAAALMGAMGAALVGMVCNLTLGKKDYAAVEDEMRATLAQSEVLRSRLMDGVRADADAFNLVMAAYGLPKHSDEEKQARTQAIQAALKSATAVPLACAVDCAEVIGLCRIVAEKGNKNVVSDAGVAVLAAYGALQSAALNVRVNTQAIKDGDFVRERLNELDALTAGMAAACVAIQGQVQTRLC